MNKKSCRSRIEEISIINKIKLNVAYTPYYMYKIEQTESPNCICGELRTINHIILACTLYNDERTEIRIFLKSNIAALGQFNN